MTAPGTPDEPRPSAPGTDPFASGTTPYGTGAAGSGPPASTSPSGQPSTPPSRSPSRARSAGRAAGMGLALALLIAVTVVFVLFVVFNGETVPISLVFVDVEAPLVVALLIAAGLGALIALLAGAVMRARRRNR